jgi:hypothetical protein
MGSFMQVSKFYGFLYDNMTRSVNVIRAKKTRKIKWARYVVYMWYRRGVMYMALMGKPEEKPLGRPWSVGKQY